MTERTYVLIFFFWAVLTVVTPTLILLSENSKPGFDLIGEKTEGIKEEVSRGLEEKHPIRTVLKGMARQLAPERTTVAAPVLASAPVSAPAPSPASRARKLLILTRFSPREHEKSSMRSKFS